MRAKWTRTHHGWSLRADAVEVEVWSIDGVTGPWEWHVLLSAGANSGLDVQIERDAVIASSRREWRRPRTAARHALAWVRRNLSGIVDAAHDEPAEPLDRPSTGGEGK